jgi:hypothetical protein
MRTHPTVVKAGRLNTSRIAIAIVASLASALVTYAANADPIVVVPGFTIERISTGAFPLVQPSGPVIDLDGNIYVARNFSEPSAVQSDLLRITPSGDVSSIVSFGNFIGGLALNSKGELFGSLQDGTIFELQNGIASIFATVGSLDSIPEKLVFDEHDNLFVALFGVLAVAKVSASGLVTMFVENLSGPFGVAFRNDLLLIGDNLNGNGPGILLEVDTRGAITRRFEPVGDRIVALATNPNSNSVFIANQGVLVGNLFGPTILRAQNGTVTPFVEGFAGYPRDLAFDSSGNLYAVDANSLYKISSSRTFAGVPGTANCHGESVSALARQFGGLPAAALALGFPSVQALQESIKSFCDEDPIRPRMR